MSEYQSIVSSLSLHTWNQDISTSIGQPVDQCEIAGYYVMADDECHELLSPRNVTCSGNGFMSLMTGRFWSKCVDHSMTEHITEGKECVTLVYFT